MGRAHALELDEPLDRSSPILGPRISGCICWAKGKLFPTVPHGSQPIASIDAWSGYVRVFNWHQPWFFSRFFLTFDYKRLEVSMGSHKEFFLTFDYKRLEVSMGSHKESLSPAWCGRRLLRRVWRPRRARRARRAGVLGIFGRPVAWTMEGSGQTQFLPKKHTARDWKKSSEL